MMHAGNIVGAQTELAGASHSDRDGGEGLQPRQALGSNRVSPFGEASLSYIPCYRAVRDSPCATEMRCYPTLRRCQQFQAEVLQSPQAAPWRQRDPLLPGLGLNWRSCSSLNALHLKGGRGHTAVYYGFCDKSEHFQQI